MKHGLKGPSRTWLGHFFLVMDGAVDVNVVQDGAVRGVQYSLLSDVDSNHDKASVKKFIPALET